MDKEQFDEIYAKINDPNLTPKQRKDLYKRESAKLTELEKFDFLYKMNLEKKLAAPFKDELLCKKEQIGHYCLMEFSKIDRDFDMQVMFTLMTAYVHDRLRTFKFSSDSDKAAAEAFVAKLFSYPTNIGVTTNIGSDYMAALSEVVGEQNDNPAYISSIGTIDGIKQLKMKNGTVVPMPSFVQYRNAYNYCNNNLDEGRILAKHLFGTLPTTELLFKVHGVFKDMDEINAYRIKNASKVEHLYPLQVGRTILADNFKANNKGIIMYNPADPDLEIMLQGKHNIMKAEAKLMKGRVKKLDDDERIPKESMDKIRQYRKSHDRIREKISKLRQSNAPENVIAKSEAKATEVDKKLNRQIAKYTTDEEVLVTGFKIEKGKIAGRDEYITDL